MPALSCIVTVYNKAASVKACLASVRAQTASDFEVIIVDDESTDASRARIEAFLAASHDDRFTLITQKNGGPSAARNRGIDASTGTQLFFLDGDDLLEPTCFAQLLRHTVAGRDLIVRGRMDHVAADYALPVRSADDAASATASNVPTLPEIVAGGVLYERLFNTMTPELMTAACALYPRAVLTAQGIRFDEELRNTEDVLFNATLYATNLPVVCVDTVLYHYRATAGSLARRSMGGLLPTCRHLSGALTALADDHHPATRTVAQRTNAQRAVAHYLVWYLTLILIDRARDDTPAAFAAFCTEMTADAQVAQLWEDARARDAVHPVLMHIHTLLEEEQYARAQVLCRGASIIRSIRRKLLQH